MEVKETAQKLVDVMNELVECYMRSEKGLCDKHSITVAEGKIIATMDPDNSVYVNLIADQLELSKSRISRLIESLRKKDIIEKTERETDHRYNNIILTKKGIKIREEFLNDKFVRCLKIISEIPDKKMPNLIPSFEAIKDAFQIYKNTQKI